MTGRLLIVDDEQAVCWSLERAFKKAGLEVVVAASAEEASEKIAKFAPQVAMIDVQLPGRNGLSLLEEIRRQLPATRVIVMTAHGRLSYAVDAMRAGAADYLPKPFDLLAAMATVERLLLVPAGPVADDQESNDPDEIVGVSPAMQEVYKRIAIAAASDMPVLITGETGVGKDLVARAIHKNGPRRDRPFVPVHIASLNESVIESELFGRARGAYTGATDAKRGLFEIADGGTLFLDEIGEAPPALQTKLLRVVEQQELLAVGATEPIRLDLRIVAATNRDLRAGIDAGRFRADFYYRLNAFEIHVPPLRRRREDLQPLARHFLKLAGFVGELPAATIAKIESIAWPGNARELKNSLANAAALARGGAILPEHIPVASPSGDGITNSTAVAAAVAQWVADRIANDRNQELHRDLTMEIERTLLTQVLSATQGNRALAARWLGLDRATLRKKIANLGLAPDEADLG